ncbi:MAG: hypothetical protein O6852_03435 [Gammaproteobacteria bacterium]|jgi:hypothetical protein|nr:hypothetical protein [Gammaproteobacteria bacterium]
MPHDVDITRAIQEYLAEQFPNATTEEWEHEKQESINFNILENGKTYVLRVMDECLVALRAEEVKPMLENYNVAQVMRDIGDFPIVVTNSGCIFGSP